MTRIGGLFGRSPFGPIHEMMLKVAECVEKLSDLVTTFREGKRRRVESVARAMDRLESQADAIKQGIRQHLSASLFSSIERAETLSVVSSMDDVADTCQDAARLVAMRRTPLPRELAGRFARFAKLLGKQARELAGATADLQEASARARGRAYVAEVLARLAPEDWEPHMEEHVLLTRLFEIEKKLDPISVVLLMEIVRAFGLVAGKLENAAEAVHRMAVNR